MVLDSCAAVAGSGDGNVGTSRQETPEIPLRVSGVDSRRVATVHSVRSDLALETGDGGGGILSLGIERPPETSLVLRELVGESYKAPVRLVCASLIPG